MKIEAGFVTQAKAKWYGDGFAYLWKENKFDNYYMELWSNPRVTKTENNGKEQAFSKNRRRKMQID